MHTNEGVAINWGRREEGGGGRDIFYHLKLTFREAELER